jgi:hypothetical protein
LLIGACGSSGPKAASSRDAGQRQATSTIRVSTNPYLAQIDGQCAQVMPAVRAAVQNAQQVVSGSAAAADPSTVDQAVQDVTSLNTSTQDLVVQYNVQAGPSAAPIGEWHATLELLYAQLQYFLHPESGPTTPVEAAPHVIEAAQRPSAYADHAAVPDCAPTTSTISPPATAAQTSPPSTATQSTPPSETKTAAATATTSSPNSRGSQQCAAAGLAEGGGSVDFTASGIDCTAGQRVVAALVQSLQRCPFVAGQPSTGTCNVAGFTCRIVGSGPVAPGSLVTCAKGEEAVEVPLGG